MGGGEAKRGLTPPLWRSRSSQLFTQFSDRMWHEAGTIMHNGDSFEIGDAQAGNWLANRPLWLSIAAIATACMVPFFYDSVKFWSSAIIASVAWVVGLGGHVKIIVDSGKKEIRVSQTTLWSEKPLRVVGFEEIVGSEIGYNPAGDGDTYLPRLILRSGEKLALTTTGCEGHSAAEDMTRRVMKAVETNAPAR
jgi:hypothetical protein